MRFANPHPPRRGAFFLIALFSCLQIIFGFFLFTGEGHDSVLPPRTSVQVAAMTPAAASLNALQPASGTPPQTSGQSALSYAKERCTDDNGTFFFFREYREKIKQKARSARHAALKIHKQQNLIRYNSAFPSPAPATEATTAIDPGAAQRYNPVNVPVIADNTRYSASSRD